MVYVPTGPVPWRVRLPNDLKCLPETGRSGPGGLQVETGRSFGAREA